LLPNHNGVSKKSTSVLIARMQNVRKQSMICLALLIVSAPNFN